MTVQRVRPYLGIRMAARSSDGMPLTADQTGLSTSYFLNHLTLLTLRSISLSYNNFAHCTCSHLRLDTVVETEQFTGATTPPQDGHATSGDVELPTKSDITGFWQR